MKRQRQHQRPAQRKTALLMAVLAVATLAVAGSAGLVHWAGPESRSYAVFEPLPGLADEFDPRSP